MLRTIAKKFVFYHGHVRGLERDILKTCKISNSFLLDAGCGDGSFFLASFGQRNNSIGIDSNRKEVRRAKGKYGHVVLGDISALPIRSSSLNCIICNSVLEHIKELRRVLLDFNRSLHNGSKTYITVANAVDSGIIRELSRVLFRNYYGLNTEKWVQLFIGSGFLITRAKEYSSKITHTIYVLSCAFIPLMLASFFFSRLLPRINAEGFHLFLEAEKN